jgi:opacity protein-like surface antigen
LRLYILFFKLPMRFILLILLITVFTSVNSQTLFADGGMSVSRLSLKVTPSYPGLEDIYNDFFNQSIFGYSYNVGAKYRDRKYFNMYSMAGIIKKAGKRTININDYEVGVIQNINIHNFGITQFTVKGELQYVIFSTGVDFKYPVNDRFYPYIRIGPHIDYLLDFTNNIEQFIGDQQKELNAVQAGLLFGAGLAYKFNRFEIELKSAYLLNFLKIYERKEPSLSKPSVEFDDKTFIFNLGVGFNLQKPHKEN